MNSTAPRDTEPRRVSETYQSLKVGLGEFVMAVLLSVSDRARIQSTADTTSRIKSAQSTLEAVAIATAKVRNLRLITVEQVLNRAKVGEIVLIGGQNANILTGKAGNGKPHVSLRTQYALATPEECAAFIKGLNVLPTVEAVQEAWYRFQEQHVIPAVAWEGEKCFEDRDYADLSARFSGTLRADSVTGNVSIAGLTRTDVATKPTAVAKASTFLDALLGSSEQIAGVPAPSPAPAPAPAAPAAPAPAAAPAPTMKMVNGQAFSTADLLAAGWTAEQVAGLPNA